MNLKNKLPLYVGVTDFDISANVRNMSRLVPCHSRRVLMNGFMCSYKVLRGLPSKWTTRWIPPSELFRVCIEHPKVLNTLHWADYKDMTTGDDLVIACSHCGPHLHAVQLDMIWPYASLVCELFSTISGKPIILQIGTNALACVDNDPGKMMKELNKYCGLSGVLLDKSVGQGQAMDASILRPFVDIISRERPDLVIAVAGGLGVGKLGQLEILLREYPDLSWDAQGQLHIDANPMYPVDWSRAAQYLKESFALCI